MLLLLFISALLIPSLLGRADGMVACQKLAERAQRLRTKKLLRVMWDPAS